MNIPKTIKNFFYQENNNINNNNKVITSFSSSKYFDDKFDKRNNYTINRNSFWINNKIKLLINLINKKNIY